MREPVLLERKKEIGIMKAIGAKNSDIFYQFFIESGLLGLIGGIIGIIIGTTFSLIASLVLTHFMDLNWPFSFPIPAVIAGIVVSASVGLIFGIYPASKAARKSPIEALNYE